MKYATWNVNSLNVRLDQLQVFLQTHAPEVLVLQETKTVDEKFPVDAIKAMGYHVSFHGQKTYNGVAILSLAQHEAVQRNIPDFEDPQARVIAATVGSVRVIGAYFPNGQAPGSEKFEYKMRWLRALNTFLRRELKQHPELALMGDFNICPDDRDVFDPVAWKEQIHCTEEEREAFRSIVALGLVDTLRAKHEAAQIYTWWDYRQLGFRKNQGLRIDHILVTPPMLARLQDCVVDKQTRKNERPSDHAPVIASFS